MPRIVGRDVVQVFSDGGRIWAKTPIGYPNASLLFVWVVANRLSGGELPDFPSYIWLTGSNVMADSTAGDYRINGRLKSFYGISYWRDLSTGISGGLVPGASGTIQIDAHSINTSWGLLLYVDGLWKSVNNTREINEYPDIGYFNEWVSGRHVSTLSLLSQPEDLVIAVISASGLHSIGGFGIDIDSVEVMLTGSTSLGADGNWGFSWYVLPSPTSRINNVPLFIASVRETVTGSFTSSGFGEFAGASYPEMSDFVVQSNF